MKHKPTGFAAALLVLALALSGSAWAWQGQTGPRGPGNGGQPQTGTVTDAEASAVLHMLEEEKLARDVYAALGRLWGSNDGDCPAAIFTNTAGSEQQHMNALINLSRRFGLDASVADLPPGQFKDADFQVLYDQLVQTGSQGLVQALGVGVFVEELDIFDLQEYLHAVANPFVRQVFQNLLKGSRNHLRAYFARLTAMGGTYEPQFLTQEAFMAIVNSPMERGPVDEDGNPRGPGGPRGPRQ